MKTKLRTKTLSVTITDWSDGTQSVQSKVANLNSFEVIGICESLRVNAICQIDNARNKKK